MRNLFHWMMAIPLMILAFTLLMGLMAVLVIMVVQGEIASAFALVLFITFLIGAVGTIIAYN